MSEFLTLSDAEVDYWGDQYIKWQESLSEDILNRLPDFERQQYFWAHNFAFSEFVNLCFRYGNKSTSLISRFK